MLLWISESAELEVSAWLQVTSGHYLGSFPRDRDNTPPFSFTHSSLFPEDMLRENGTEKEKPGAAGRKTPGLTNGGRNICHPPPQKLQRTKEKKCCINTKLMKLKVRAE